MPFALFSFARKIRFRDHVSEIFRPPVGIDLQPDRSQRARPSDRRRWACDRDDEPRRLETVYQTDGAKHQSIATTTGADGKARGKIVYQQDAVGRYESGQVFAPDGKLRFQTRYRYDAAGRLAEETQLAKDDSVRNRIVYSYNAEGHQIGYAIYDGEGRLLGRTTPKQSAGPARAGSKP